MALIRPELAAAAHRWREVAAAGAAGAAGLWIASAGGWVLMPLGGIIAAAAAVWAVNAWRRVRFAQEVAAPGLVEVNEGQIAYMGPAFGGFAALEDLVEIRLMTMRGRRLWRMKQTDGQVLLVPVDAAGAAALFDAFAALPGMDMAGLVGALDGGTGPAGETGLTLGPQMTTVWHRPGQGVARA